MESSAPLSCLPVSTLQNNQASDRVAEQRNDISPISCACKQGLQKSQLLSTGCCRRSFDCHSRKPYSEDEKNANAFFFNCLSVSHTKIQQLKIIGIITDICQKRDISSGMFCSVILLHIPTEVPLWQI